MSGKHIDELRKEEKKNRHKDKKEKSKEVIQETYTDTVTVSTKEPEPEKEKATPVNKDELIKQLRLTLQTLMIKYIEIQKHIQDWRLIMSELGGEMSHQSRVNPNLMAINPKELDIGFIEKQIQALGPDKKIDLNISQRPGQGQGQPQ